MNAEGHMERQSFELGLFGAARLLFSHAQPPSYKSGVQGVSERATISDAASSSTAKWGA